MARPIWNGSLSFGLVNVPVALHGVLRDRDVHFRQLHEPDGSPIRTKRFCADEGVEVPPGELAHGYDLEDGTRVVLTDEELEAAAPRKTRTIDIEAFVDGDALDPLLLERAYVLVPTGETDGVRRAYRLLHDVMERTGRVALGRLVLRAKEHLVAVSAADGLLRCTTMRFADELRPAGDVDTGGARRPAKKALDTAVALVEGLATAWEPERYEDEHRRRLQAAVEGADRTAEVHPDAGGGDADAGRGGGAPDLMAALTQSLKAARSEDAKDGKGGRRGQGGTTEKDGKGGDLGALTREELYERAQAADLPGRSSMTKAQLVEALS